MSADNSAWLRDLLANDRTLLAYIRTGIAFSGLGFAVAKFAPGEKPTHLAQYLGIVMVIVGLAVTMIGYVQHHAVAVKSGLAPPGTPVPSRAGYLAATAAAALVCILLIIYLAATGT